MCQSCVKQSNIATIHELVAEHVSKTKKLDHDTIQALLSTLDLVTLEEVGLAEYEVKTTDMDEEDNGKEAVAKKEKMVIDSTSVVSKSQTGERIHFQAVYEYADFELSLFILPKGAKLPLHDHPNMVVISKVLQGSLRIKSYDWAEQPKVTVKNDNTTSLYGAVRPHVNDVFRAPTPATILYPTFGGNIHELEAVEDTILVDILLPPYSTVSGRPCNYYRLTNSNFVVQIPEPSDFFTVRQEYKGMR